MESIRIIISAEYSEFKTFLNDFLFRLYGRQAKDARVRNDNESTGILSIRLNNSMSHLQCQMKTLAKFLELFFGNIQRINA
jgi:hypothetical protein